MTLGKHVRFGSLAAATADGDRVRFTPNNGHEDGQLASPLWAKSGHRTCVPSSREVRQRPPIWGVVLFACLATALKSEIGVALAWFSSLMLVNFRR